MSSRDMCVLYSTPSRTTTEIRLYSTPSQTTTDTRLGSPPRHDPGRLREASAAGAGVPLEQVRLRRVRVRCGQGADTHRSSQLKTDGRMVGIPITVEHVPSELKPGKIIDEGIDEASGCAGPRPATSPHRCTLTRARARPQTKVGPRPSHVQGARRQADQADAWGGRAIGPVFDPRRLQYKGL